MSQKKEYLKPADFSAYLNIRSGFSDFINRFNNFNGVVSLYDWSLISYFSKVPDKEIEFQSINLRKYNPNKNYYTILGNHTLSRSSEISNNIFGIHKDIEVKKINKENNLSQKLFVNEVSEIEFLHNNASIFKKKLYPGIYTFKKYPTSEGMNYYALINHKTNEKTVQTFYKQSKTIEKGRKDYIYSLGLDNSEKKFINQKKGIDYLSLNYIQSLGLSDITQLDSGLFFSNKLFSITNTFTIYHYYFNHKIIFKNSLKKENGFSIITKHLPNKLNGNIKYSLSTFVNKRFITNKNLDLGLGINLTQKPNKNSLLNIQIESSLVPKENNFTQKINLNLSNKISSSINLSNSISLEKSSLNKNSIINYSANLASKLSIFLIRLNYQLTKEIDGYTNNISFTVSQSELPIKTSYDSNTQSYSANSNINFEEHNITTGLGFTTADNQKTIQINRDDRYIPSELNIIATDKIDKLSFNSETSKGSFEFEKKSNKTSFDLETSLLFIDNKFYISDQIKKGFVVFKENGQSHKKIKANNKESWFGHPVIKVSNQNSKIDVQNIYGMNYKYYTNDFQKHIKTPLHKGYIYTINYENNIIYKAVLKNEYTDVLKFNTVKVFSIDDPEFKTRVTMTNARGKIFISNIKPGTYYIIVDNPKFNPLKIVIPKNEKSIINAGNIIIPFAEKEELK